MRCLNLCHSQGALCRPLHTTASCNKCQICLSSVFSLILRRIRPRSFSRKYFAIFLASPKQLVKPAEHIYDIMEDVRQPRWGHASTVHSVLAILRYAYSPFILGFFLAALTLCSIAASRRNPGVVKSTATGPAGKRLPATDPTRNFMKKTVLDDVTQTQKRVFGWLSLATALTVVGNSVLVIAQALVKQSEHWWCGQSVVRCLLPRKQRENDSG